MPSAADCVIFSHPHSAGSHLILPSTIPRSLSASAVPIPLSLHFFLACAARFPAEMRSPGLGSSRSDSVQTPAFLSCQSRERGQLPSSDVHCCCTKFNKVQMFRSSSTQFHDEKKLKNHKNSNFLLCSSSNLARFLSRASSRCESSSRRGGISFEHRKLMGCEAIEKHAGKQEGTQKLQQPR
jgi:hypothetical protein